MLGISYGGLVPILSRLYLKKKRNKLFLCLLRLQFLMVAVAGIALFRG